MNTPSAPHRWYELFSFNAAICLDCGLDEYSAEGLPCQGSRSYACPTQSNGFAHGTCAEQFDSQAAAQRHWVAVHASEVR